MNKKILIPVAVILLSVLIIGWAYNTFFATASQWHVILFIAIGALILGVVVMFLFNKAYQSSNQVTIKESSHTIIESMRKVFKIVTSEGQFNEIYNYEESSKLFGFIPTQKKALVIISAKTLIGYDFEKCQWEIDEINRTIHLKAFPPPEILSIDTDYKYYNIEENIFNKFSREDLASIQKNGKTQVIQAAQQSRLPQIAAEQMRLLMSELFSAKDWKILNLDIITQKPTLRLPHIIDNA